MEWIKAGYESRHGVAVPERAVCISSSTVKVQQLAGISRRMASSFSPFSAPGMEVPILPSCLFLLWCFYTLAVISLSYQIEKENTLQCFDLLLFSSDFFSSAFMSHCGVGKEEVRALRPSREGGRKKEDVSPSVLESC